MTTGRIVALLAALAAAAALALVALNRPGATPAFPSGDAQRGAYVARAGNCLGCHATPGDAPGAGGGVVHTPFGRVVAPNLTPDPATGLGRWTLADFWHALHDGRAADGRLLVPACPYPNYTLVSPADVSDLFAWLRSLPPVQRPRAPQALRFPYGTQPALALWRALHFRPGQPPDDRGEYLVAGLGHCSACHGRRDAWGANGGPLDLRGGTMPGAGWYAPALDDPAEGGLAVWPLEDGVRLLKHGQGLHAGVSGPMALVVARSLQHLRDDDVAAMVAFLQALPPRGPAPAPPAAPPPPERQALGERLYERHCADCHGREGRGAPPEVPALAGNRALVMAVPDNVIRVVLGGGFGPSTAGQPRPHGMPPFATLLSDDEIAALVSHLRSSWGHRASSVDAQDVNRQRGS